VTCSTQWKGDKCVNNLMEQTEMKRQAVRIKMDSTENWACINLNGCS